MTSQVRCRTHERRGAPALNAIDYLEVSADQLKLAVHFFHPIIGAPLTKDNIAITGGTRVTGFVIAPPVAAGDVLTITVDRPGDFSTYTLRLVASVTSDAAPAGYDPHGVTVDFTFKAGCPSRFDCAPRCDCPRELPAPPDIDYLARDYATFRRLLLDRMSLILPSWQERNAADAGITLVELLSYVGDHLSYQLDAVATEAYLGTARRRTSLHRIARLLDYDMHDGCNARVWVQVRASSDVLLPESTLLCTKTAGHGAVIAPERMDALDANGAEFFETMEPLQVRKDYDVLPFYTWGDRHCCLPKGATRATLAGQFPFLDVGTVLVLKELVGPESGHASDADPRHAHPVRLSVKPVLDTDPLTTTKVTEIEWHAEDALPFPLCISADTTIGFSSSISAALGNIVLADHGRTVGGAGGVSEALPRVEGTPTFLTPVNPASHTCSDEDPDPAPPRYAPLLRHGPVTQTATLAQSRFGAGGGEQPRRIDRSKSASSAFDIDPRTALPSITLSDGTRPWSPRRDLLASDAFAPDFVVEVERDGAASLRFGDDSHGRRPDPGQNFNASYRIGNGPRGNVGIGAIAHVVSSAANINRVTAVANPLAARGGTDAEGMEDVRQKAPVAFRRQERAVTPLDYEEVAQRHREIQRAAATFRWTGSWHTVFLTVDRAGGLPVDEPFERVVRTHMERFRMAGYDLEIDAPRFVPLEIHIHVCVAPDFFRGDVEQALLDAFGSGVRLDGQQGFFHPDRFTFGQAVYLSRIYAAAHAVPGVASIDVQRFERQGVANTSGLASGSLAMQRLEIARLDNDPNFPDNGVLRLKLDGGR